MSDDYPIIVSMPDCEEVDYLYWTDKGYLNGCIVKCSDSKRYQVFFVTPTRLMQELAAGISCGEPFFDEPGLIVVSEITMEIVELTVKALYEKGFFNYLKQMDENDDGLSGYSFGFPKHKVESTDNSAE